MRLLIHPVSQVYPAFPVPVIFQELAFLSIKSSSLILTVSTESAPGAVAVLEADQATDSPWVTIVWDDPVNLMRYVVFVFQQIFGFSDEKANKLMMQVHEEGKAVVSAGDREQMEADVQKLQAAGLWATMQHDSSR